MISYNFNCSSKGVSEPEGTCECVPCKSEADPVVPFFDETKWEEIARARKIPVLDPAKVTYDEFFTNYLLTNIPCLFSAGVTSSWSSRQEWIREGGSNDCLNFEKLRERYGDAQVHVVNCDDKEYGEGYGSRDCRQMSFKEFADYWQDCMASNKDSSENTCLYLKDWHIIRFHKMNDITELPYETPIFFQSDWLNEYCDKTDSDDYKFCYMGPKSSFTSFHADVYGSYSWSANVSGMKKWFLYPPGKERRFLSSGKVKFDWKDPGVLGEDYIEVIQNAGECIFVPSGWHHVVWNLTDAVSINHNWFNGANICYIWKILQQALKEVERELEDFKEIPEFVQQCQIVLKANHGMDYKGFFEVLRIISEDRRSSSISSAQLHFDMTAIQHVIEEHCSVDPVVQAHFGSEIEWFRKFRDGGDSCNL